ncbi:MAG: peptide chain release factor N(5)-glutamine methyltransferase [Spirochaetaceae bacterium]|jgi:release factor glutamine methyltransferase|nr:peptide chain release factor N(5)-glutamine methyltransferase [Spirochaetaceae bacterium]
MTTVKDALKEATQRLREADIQTPALDAELLLAHTLDADRTHIALHADRVLGRTQRTAYESLIARRLRGECVAYIVGRKAFRHIELLVNKDVLVPRPETEALVEAALETIDRAQTKAVSVLDLCCGSGAIALALLDERPGIKASAADLSEAALAVARANHARLFGAARPLSLIHSDLFDNIAARFHLIVSNPPYVPSATIPTLAREVQGEPRLALDGGPDGLSPIRKIIAAAPPRLLPNGRLLLEAAPSQIKEIIRLMEGSGYRDIACTKDLSGRERVIEGTIIEGGAPAPVPMSAPCGAGW